MLGDAPRAAAVGLGVLNFIKIKCKDCGETFSAAMHKKTKGIAVYCTACRYKRSPIHERNREFVTKKKLER